MDNALSALTGYASAASAWVLASGLRIGLILILMWVALRVANLASNTVLARLRVAGDVEAEKRVDTLAKVLRLVFRIFVFALAFMLILGEFGIDLGPIIAAAGVIGLAVGFGSQELVKDVISGFFMLLEDQIRVGDVVDLNGQGGIVEQITLRTVVLRDLAGNVHFVRNGTIAQVINMTKGYSRYVFDIGVSYNADVDKTIELIKEVDEELRADEPFKDYILEPIEVLGVDAFADSAVIIKARTKTLPIKQWAVGREFNRRLKYKFDEAGIEIPFPHRTVYFRTEDGELQPRVVTGEMPGSSANTQSD